MSEIKSTIELMMERTRGMRMSEAERNEVKHKELRQKAAGLRLRLLGDPTRIDETMQSLEQESADDRPFINQYLWEVIFSELPTDEKVFKHIDVMEKIAQTGTQTSLVSDLKKRLKELFKESVTDKKKILNRERKKLAAIGISGTAVMPKMPGKMDVENEIRGIVDNIKSKFPT